MNSEQHPNGEEHRSNPDLASHSELSALGHQILELGGINGEDSKVNNPQKLPRDELSPDVEAMLATYELPADLTKYLPPPYIRRIKQDMQSSSDQDVFRAIVFAYGAAKRSRETIPEAGKDQLEELFSRST